MAFGLMDFDVGNKLTLITSLSDVGVSTGGLLANFYKACPDNCYAQISVIGGTTFSDIPSGQGGLMHMFKTTNAEIHRSLIFMTTPAQASTSISSLKVGFIPYNGGTSTASKWYTITLNAI